MDSHHLTVSKATTVPNFVLGTKFHVWDSVPSEGHNLVAELCAVSRVNTAKNFSFRFELEANMALNSFSVVIRLVAAVGQILSFPKSI